MKKNIQQSIKIGAIILLVGLGSSVVFAWSAPTTTPPNGNISAPINTGSVPQIKKGKLFDEKALISNKGFFTKIFAPGSTSRVLIGGTTTADLSVSSGGGVGSSTIPLGINLLKRESSDALLISSDTAAVCSIKSKVTLVADTAPAFQLWNASKNQNADLIARQVQLTGGSPGTGKVLTSDASGNASWGTVNASGLNGKVVPDIVQIKAQYNQGSDGDSSKIDCPPGYIAIGISCDSSNDRGPDTCRFNPKSNQGNNTSGQQFPKIGNGDNNFATGASVSRDGNTDTESVQVLLTCMRYQGFETVTLIDSEISPVVTGQQCTPTGTNWVNGVCSPNSSATSTTGKARIINTSANNTVFQDNACLYTDTDRPGECLIAPYGTQLGGGKRTTSSCTLGGQSLRQQI